MSIPSRIAFASIILLILLLGVGVQVALADSTPITGTACTSHNCSSISASGPNLSLNYSGPEGGAAGNGCLGGTLCNFTFTVPTVGPCSFFTSVGSFDGQAANCVKGSLTFTAPLTYVPVISSSGVAVEFILPVFVTGQMTGYENGNEVWAINIDGTGTLDDQGGWDGSAYVMTYSTYQFSGLAYTPEPSTWIYAFSSLLAVLVAKRKKLVSFFFDAAA